MSTDDTIAAIATPSGRGGVGIVRVSGPLATAVADTITRKTLRPRYAEYGDFLDKNGQLLDQGLALFFKNPHSFTGEDVLELQGHGGPVILDALLKTVLSCDGVRLARPGEFTERAFLNDKIDLTQAEAVADLIDAGTTQAAQSALRSLQGDFSKAIQTVLTQLIELRKYVEAAIDFPEEEIDFLNDGHVKTQLTTLLNTITDIKNTAKQGVLLRDGLNLVLAGKPNTGKSSLLNLFSGKDSAIVTDIAGTTRDVLREHIQIDGLPVHIIDTAGLHETPDKIEQEGIRRAEQEIEKADRILLLMEAKSDPAPILEQHKNLLDKPLTLVFNKIDLTGKTPELSDFQGIPAVYLSAKTGEGFSVLTQHLKSALGFQENSQGTFSARRRHLEALDRATQLLSTGLTQLNEHRAGELLADDLKYAQNALSEITGAFHADDLLGEIFSSFCIGK